MELHGLNGLSFTLTAWLSLTLQRIANGWPFSQIEKLMPWNYKI